MSNPKRVMSHTDSLVCPECFEHVAPLTGLGRRDFIRVVAGGAVGMMGGSSLLSTTTAVAAAEEKGGTPKPAEGLVRELFATLTPEQKSAMVLPWYHGAEKGGPPTRLKTHNAAPLGKRLGEQFTKPQQDLIRDTFKSILSGEEAFERITRHGKWDNSGAFEGNGIAIFGDPSGKDPFSWSSPGIT